MSKRLISAIMLVVVLISCLAIPASAARYNGFASGTLNKITNTVMASTDYACGSSAPYCSSATATMAVLSVYNTSGSRVYYLTDTGITDAYVEKINYVGSYVKGSSSATINGVATTGPSYEVNYY